jgi:hypothetical protein
VVTDDKLYEKLVCKSNREKETTKNQHRGRRCVGSYQRDGFKKRKKTLEGCKKNT